MIWLVVSSISVNVRLSPALLPVVRKASVSPLANVMVVGSDAPVNAPPFFEVCDVVTVPTST